MTDAATAQDLAAVWLTLKLASVVTMLLLIIGTPIAWWLARTRSRLKGVVGAIVNAALSRTVRRDVPTSRRGELEFFASRHFPFLVDQMVNRTLSKRILSGAFDSAELARGVVSRHRT